MRPLLGSTRMRPAIFACSVFIVLSLCFGGVGRCAGSDNPRLVVRHGKKLMCTVRFISTQFGDCGTQSYDSVFTAKILAVKQVHDGGNVANMPDVSYPTDLLLTVEPQEIFKGHPSHEVQILVEQGECFAEIRAGDDWLFFGEKNAKSKGLEISYIDSNPSGPLRQKLEYIERLRRLERGDGFGYVVGEVDYPSFDLSSGELFNPQPNHRVLLKARDGEQRFSVTTDVNGRFQLGPIKPEFFEIDADTDPKLRAIWADMLRTSVRPNGCSFSKIDLEINSEISGRVILPEGYQYKKSEIGNYFPLFYVDVDTQDGKQARGTSIGDGLKFTVTGLAPGSYILQLVNYSGETWIKRPVYAPGVTDQSTALQIDLGLAEHRTGIEIRVPPDALKTAK